MAPLLYEYEQEASVAEAGVFAGDFAKWINYYFPDRKLYLFDTFQGFDSRDIAVEKENSFSVAQKGDLSMTSVDLVMSKMPHPEMCKVYVGYFPESAEGISDRFCFVNLDMDLYEPTYNGLCFFQDKMTDNGVILVHDYYSKQYTGVRPAVDRFVNECEARICRYPIGDGASIMLAGDFSSFRARK